MIHLAYSHLTYKISDIGTFAVAFDEIYDLNHQQEILERSRACGLNYYCIVAIV